MIRSFHRQQDSSSKRPTPLLLLVLIPPSFSGNYRLKGNKNDDHCCVLIRFANCELRFEYI